ncbi:MAG: hypothetical protein LBC68_06785 [Prevotellaceae bacterium]|jgi:hypothetical protein|nr:hypothetical protein [Prevotellaceae bacterium]
MPIIILKQKKFLKNRSERKAKYANKKLELVAWIGGKREFRRLLGDVILAEQR